MLRDKKSTFCKCAEVEITAHRSAQLTVASIQIANGKKQEDTEMLDMTHLECLEFAIAIPENILPPDPALAAFTFCRWFLHDGPKPEFIMELENSNANADSMLNRTYIFSQLHLLDTILQAGELNETVYVDHKYFIAEDYREKPFTFSISMSDAFTLGILIDKYSEEWPDAVLVGLGSTCREERVEIKTDDKNNMIIELMIGENGTFVRELINKHMKVYG